MPQSSNDFYTVFFTLGDLFYKIISQLLMNPVMPLP